MPELTVLMPVRDGARFVDAGIRSVLASSFTDLELIAVDDGSVDATPAILDRWAKRDPRISVITLDRSYGGAAARNRGLEIARGEFVVPFDHDDLFVPARIRPQIAALRDPGAALACGSMELIDATGRRLFTQTLAEPPEVIAHVLPFGNPIAHGTVLFRRADALEIGGYDESLARSHDYDLWLRLAARGRIVAVPGICLRYRLHPGQVTAVKIDLQVAPSLANTRRALGRADADAAGLVWRERASPGDLAAADRVFREALEASPHAGDEHFRAGVRTMTAERWTAQAARFALAGNLRAGLVCLRHASRWHPRGIPGAAELAMRRAYRLGVLRYRSVRASGRP